MATSTISGLASGLDTATIIEQFMRLEAVPQTKLKTRVTTEQTAVTSLQSLNAKLAALASKATELAAADAWDTLQATSSNAAVAVTATAAATPTSFTVTVRQTALTHQLGFADSAALTDVVTSGSVRLVKPDGTAVDLSTGSGTLQELVTALNDPANTTGVRATTVKTADGSYKLLVESTTSGAASDFELTAPDGSPLLGGATVRSGRNAEIDLGAGIVATSATNTFTDLMPGISLTLAAHATAGATPTNPATADITVARDGSTRADALKAFVDSINAVLTDVASLTTYNSVSRTAGKLQGDTLVRSIARGLVESVYPGDNTSMATYGLEVDRFGKLTFDADVFKKAYAADPAAVTAGFTGTGGFASRIEKVATAASDKYKGTITAAITGRNDGIARLQDSIERWDQRLELRRATLTRQFTALETALSQMNSQSSWLAGQIGSLPSSSA